jgi:hypothetical protein
MKRIGYCLLIFLGLAFTSPSIADTLLVESVVSGQSVPQPDRGMNMEGVLNRFGEPTQRSGPVGEPPISWWTYPDFVVYFEHRTVLHSVIPPR